MNGFKVALSFLTCLPIPGGLRYSPEAEGQSLLWYPVVGLIVGLALLATASVATQMLPALPVAAIVVVVWVALTGALHLDGLADCADAWCGAHRSESQRALTLTILKDPRCGAMAVVAIVLSLLLRFSLLTAVIDTGALGWLWVVPVFARASILGLFMSTPYVSSEGIGSALAQHFPSTQATPVLMAVAASALLILPFGLFVAMALTMGGVFWWLRALMLKRLQGFTGDCAGALIEIMEIALLLVLAIHAA